MSDLVADLVDFLIESHLSVVTTNPDRSRRSTVFTKSARPSMETHLCGRHVAKFLISSLWQLLLMAKFSVCTAD